MRIGIPEHRDRISPVFDVASRLLVADIENGGVRERSYVSIPPGSPAGMIRAITGAGVEVIICGAISGVMMGMLESAGVRVYGWISGNVEEVLGAWCSEHRIPETYTMPGCRGCRRRRMGRNRERRRS
ncbi:NifB/NifX family molybdenum-iron cluster-binding protein [bacterium]|nr:NifB/NifX family molybdenum-iron cluster-binding protein [candidate division CSSED10-310 bacterium]